MPSKTKPKIITRKDEDVVEESAVAQAYEHPHAHLLDELRWLNLLLAAQVQNMRRVNFHDNPNDLLNYFIPDEEIDALIARATGDDSGTGQDQLSEFFLNRAAEVRQEIDKRVGLTISGGRHLPLADLYRHFGLNLFEVRALLICLAPHIDIRYARFYAYLQNDATKELASIDLVLDLLCRSSAMRLRFLPALGSTGRLRHFALIEPVENRSKMSVPSRFLRADPSVLDYVLNHQAQDQRLLSCLRFQPPLPWQKAIVESATRDRLQKLLQIGLADEEQESPYTLYLHGRPGVGKKTIAQALCGEVGLELGVADLRILVRMPGDFATHVRLVLREAWLRPCIIYFDHFEILEQLAQEKPELLKTFLEETGSFGWVTVIAGENPLPSSLVRMSRLVAVEIPAPDFATQKQIWGVHLNGTGSQFEEGQLDLLANQFALTGGQIARAASRARKTAFAHDPENGEPAFDDLLAGSRIQSQPKLSTLARKIEPLFHWPDLVLPDDKIAQLQELSDHLKHRQKVMKEWGFHNKLSLGRGITALFAGPSGTGKTMAAEVIANDLALDLYKIDLSSVVSKYIGETEKNLSKIFQEAQHSNAILFFDEADALFGKRSEVKDAHDRHANIEVGYLLQKMEEYEGVVIMATNLAKNMDEAFTRRMRFSIDFPMPTEKYRRRIWGGIWPSETPLGSELDLDMIAREFDFAGGNIRNIALAAAYLAAAEDTTVSMAHLKHATQREYQKMGRMIVPQDFAHFAIDS